MKKVTITARAVSLIEEYAKQFATEQGPGYVPVIVWVAGDRSSSLPVAQFVVGFEKRAVVDRSRVMECDGRDVDIFQCAPDDAFGPDWKKVVDLRNNMFVIVDKNEDAS
jgi:hypothetical protein